MIGIWFPELLGAFVSETIQLGADDTVITVDSELVEMETESVAVIVVASRLVVGLPTFISSLTMLSIRHRYYYCRSLENLRLRDVFRSPHFRASWCRRYGCHHS